MGNERNMRQVRTAASDFQTRAEENGDLYIEGYFAVFNSDYEIFPGATESIANTAFDDTLDEDIRCLIDHDTRLVLGRNRAGTLRLSVDGHGLWGKVKINPRDQDAMNLYERVKRHDVDQCSFGFEILDEEFEQRGENVHWTIRKVRLHEVTVATFPAYVETSVSARKAQLSEIKKRSFEAWQQKMINKLKGKG